LARAAAVIIAGHVSTLRHRALGDVLLGSRGDVLHPVRSLATAVVVGRRRGLFCCHCLVLLLPFRAARAGARAGTIHWFHRLSNSITKAPAATILIGTTTILQSALGDPLLPIVTTTLELTTILTMGVGKVLCEMMNQKKPRLRGTSVKIFFPSVTYCLM